MSDPIEIRIAVLRALVALDTTVHCRNPVCEAACSAAIAALLPLAVRPDGPEDFFPINELEAAISEQTTTATARPSRGE